MTRHSLPLSLEDSLSSHSPKLLVSVSDSLDAEAAIAGGADWFDLKEPRAGPLGAVKTQRALEILATLGPDRAVSAALGELVDWPSSPARDLLTVAGLHVVKLGLHGCEACARWPILLREAAERIREHNKELAAVCYADWQTAGAPPPDRVIPLAADFGCRYLLVDTYDKGRGPLTRVFSQHELVRILRSAKRLGMHTVLGGGLVHEELRQLPLQEIDVVAVRGGVCRGGRSNRVDRTLVAAFRATLNA